MVLMETLSACFVVGEGRWRPSQPWGAPGRPTERGTPVNGTGRRVDEVAAACAIGSMGTWKAWEAWVDFSVRLASGNWSACAHLSASCEP